MMGDAQNVLIDELSAWFAKMSSGEATDADRRAFDTWLGAAPERRAAYDRFQALLGEIDEMFLDRDAPEVLLDVAAPSPAVSRRRRREGIRPLRLRDKPALAATAAALVVVVAGWLIAQPGRYSPAATAVGEQRTLTLADGSNVILNTDTSLSYRTAQSSRSIRLARGEAFFKVRKNPKAPFVVAVDEGEVRAVGTAFNVRSWGGQTDVSVKEGVVVVRAHGGQEGRLLAGDHAVLAPTGLRIIQRGDNAASVDAWTQGRLVYRNQTLRFVVKDLDRYFEGRLVADGPLVDTRVSAVINLGDERTVLTALSQQLPISVSHRADHVTIISVVPQR